MKSCPPNTLICKRHEKGNISGIFTVKFQLLLLYPAYRRLWNLFFARCIVEWGITLQCLQCRRGDCDGDMSLLLQSGACCVFMFSWRHRFLQKSNRCWLCVQRIQTCVFRRTAGWKADHWQLLLLSLPKLAERMFFPLLPTYFSLASSFPF